MANARRNHEPFFVNWLGHEACGGSCDRGNRQIDGARLVDQERALRLCQSLGERELANARRHRDIVCRFGRFPHRNAILGRTPRVEELRYLADGGYAG